MINFRLKTFSKLIEKFFTKDEEKQVNHGN